MKIDTSFLLRCTNTLEKAFQLLSKDNNDEIDYDIYRSACVKEFEIIIEQSGRLLKKALIPYFSSAREVDRLHFKDIFRYAGIHGLLTLQEVERWMEYRDNRNLTAHNYGESLAEELLNILPSFISDSRLLILAIEKKNNHAAD